MALNIQTPTAKVLLISAPSKDIEINKTHIAKIASDIVTFTDVFTSKKDSTKQFQIAQIKVCIDGFTPFNASILSEKHNEFATKYSVDSEIKVFVNRNEKGYMYAEL